MTNVSATNNSGAPSGAAPRSDEELQRANKASVSQCIEDTFESIKAGIGILDGHRNDALDRASRWADKGIEHGERQIEDLKTLSRGYMGGYQARREHSDALLKQSAAQLKRLGEDVGAPPPAPGWLDSFGQALGLRTPSQKAQQAKQEHRKAELQGVGALVKTGLEQGDAIRSSDARDVEAALRDIVSEAEGFRTVFQRHMQLFQEVLDMVKGQMPAVVEEKLKVLDQAMQTLSAFHDMDVAKAELLRKERNAEADRDLAKKKFEADHQILRDKVENEAKAQQRADELNMHREDLSHKLELAKIDLQRARTPAERVIIVNRYLRRFPGWFW